MWSMTELCTGNKRVLKIESQKLLYYVTNLLEMSEVIVAKHTAIAVFVIPEQYRNLPLYCFQVLRDTLFIYSDDSPHKLLCEVGASIPADESIDWKRPDSIDFDTKDNYPGIDDSDDEDEEESPKKNTDSQ